MSFISRWQPVVMPVFRHKFTTMTTTAATARTTIAVTGIVHHNHKRHRSTLSKMHRRACKEILHQKEKQYNSKVNEEMENIRSKDLLPYEATKSMSDLPSAEQPSADSRRVPFVKPLNEPHPSEIFNEVRPEPLLVWNNFQERYELRDKRILSEKTKKTILSMHRRFPQKYSPEYLSANLGLSPESIDFIFWENEMRLKYKIPYDLDTIKLLEAYCGTDDILESKAHTLMAYSEVTGDPFFTSGKMHRASPLIVHEDEMDEHLYSWQKRQQYKPRLSKDQFEIIPSDGSGSGQALREDDYSRSRDSRSSYIIVDVDDDTVGRLHNKAMSVKVRECNGHMRWSTVEEVNYVRHKEYPRGVTVHDRMRTKSKRKWPKRMFPRRPYLDRNYVEHHWKP